VHLPAEQVEELQNRILLCYTGKARLSSNIHRNVWGNFREGRRETLDALFGLRQSAYDAKEALEAWDLQRFADIVTDQRHYMKHLDASTSNEQIKQIFDLVDEDILGGKPCGAGGGGCLFFIARDANAKETARKKLVDQDLVALDITFDFEGVQLSHEEQ
jgi:D-glycero-alpha-D-manno-heptose-7-phosphate kinase